MYSVVLNYRREDSAGSTGRIYDRLAGQVGSDQVVKDIALQGPGTIITDEIERVVSEAKLIFVIIGRRWLTPVNGQRRIDRADDPVRFEIETAIAKGITIVPVLVDGATMPTVEELPVSIAAIARITPMTLRSDPFFTTDSQQVIGATSYYAKVSANTRKRPPNPGRNRLLLGLSILMAALIVATGYSIHLIGQALQQVTTSAAGLSQLDATLAAPAYPQMNGISMLSPSEGWAVGNNNRILHYINGVWNVSPSPVFDSINSVVAISKDNALAAGGTASYLHYDGTSWQKIVIPPNVYPGGTNSIGLVSPTEAWFVGDSSDISGIAHVKDGQWSGTANPNGQSLNGVVMLSATEGWAVGNNGTILHFIKGAWATVASPTLQSLHGITWANGDGWAVGDGGTLLHYTNGAWQLGSVPTTTVLNSVAFSANGQEGWIVGTKGTILHFSKGAWKTVPPVVSANLRAVNLLADGEAFAVGDCPVLHEANGVWSTMTTPASSN